MDVPMSSSIDRAETTSIRRRFKGKSVFKAWDMAEYSASRVLKLM